MNAKTVLSLLIFLFTSHLLSAQKEALVEKLEAIEENISSAAFNKFTYDQSWVYDEDKPYLITFTVDQTNKKGQVKQMTYTFNLAFLNPRLIRRTSSNSEMKVELKTGGEDLIYYELDGEPKGYEDQLNVYTEEVDNARALEPLFEEAVPLAKALWEVDNEITQDFATLSAWIADNIQSIDIGDKSITQTLESAEETADRYDLIQTISTSKKQGDAETFRFSFGDLNDKGIAFKVKGTEVYLVLETNRKLPFMEVFDEEGKNEFVSSLNVYFESPGAAKLAAEVFKSAIPFYKTKLVERMPTVDSSQKVMPLLAEAMIDFNADDEQLTQTLEDQCATTYQIALEGEKTSRAEAFAFHLEDLDANNVFVKKGKNGLEVNVKTRQSLKYIQYQKDGEIKSYTNQVDFIAPSVESARLIAHLLPSAIKSCQREIMGKDMDWLGEALQKISTVEPELNQELGAVKDNACKGLFTLTKSGKKTTTVQHEFNWHDLAEKNAKLLVKGTNVQIDLSTNFNEKIISLYEDESDLEFANKMTFYMPGIETAKMTLATIKLQIETCKAANKD